MLGTLATIGTYRYEFRLKKYLNAMLYIPLVIPELVIGLASLAAFSRMGMKMGLDRGLRPLPGRGRHGSRRE